jgi:D-alanyl-D-alanine carboxypeptidase/D-alanyl-D-alanine-endopeptidase (penicillin-binding protein 4)
LRGLPGLSSAAAVAAAAILLARDVRSETASPSAPAAAPAPSQAPAPTLSPELSAAVHAIAADRAIAGATVGVAILDVDSGKMLAAVNEHVAVNPASNAKLYTAAAALAILRGEHRYETLLSGKIEGDAVVGPLGLRGYGDPSLTTADLYAMVHELKQYGVKRVGDIFVDQRFFDELTTPPAFDQQPNEWASFRAPVSAVALDENCVTLTVRASSPGNPARIDLEPPGFVDVEGTIRTSESAGADTVELALAGNGGRMSAKVSGAVGSDSRVVRYTRRAEDPRLLAGFALKALLDEADVKVTGEVKLGAASAAHVIAKHTSAPLSSLLYSLGKQSDNFYAEMVFKSLGGEAHGRPARSGDSAEVVTRWLEKIGAADAGMTIKNGSGLFDANRVTAWSTVELLRWAWREPSVQPEYVAQLSVGGVDGTLHRRFKGELTRRHVRAKTGTLDDVIALSGYLLRDDGKGPIAFSIYFNHVGGKQDGARHAADRLVDLVAKWGRSH